MFIDAPFIKNWFRINDEALASEQYLDLRNPLSLQPLMYMGVLQNLTLGENFICEMWLASCGSHVYHVHERDDSRYDTYAGGNPIARKRQPGRVYLLFTTEAPEWIPLILRSVKASFGRDRRFGGNCAIQDDSKDDPFLHELDEASREELGKIMALPEEKSMGFATDPYFEQRFLAKFALGLGFNILGQPFLNTSYAIHLRNALWEKDAERRKRIPLRGSGFFGNEANETDTFVGWPGAYTIRLHIVAAHFVLTLHFPSGRAVHIVISDDPSLWVDENFDKYRNGAVFLVLPQLGQFVGPVPLPQYLAHRLGNIKLPELAAVEERRVDRASLPRCR
jgi:hypothetical protein